MEQRIGNVGILNLLNATEESVKNCGTIGNIGIVLYRTGSSHFLGMLSTGNIGRTVEVPDGYGYYNGMMTIDKHYIQSLEEPVRTVVNGIVILRDDIEQQDLKSSGMELIIHGKIYTPPHLAGLASRYFAEGSREIETYEGTPPRFENGAITVNNSFLKAVEEPVHLVVNGKLDLSKDLDMDLFEQKVKRLEVNGLLSVFDEQEVQVHKKMKSMPNGIIEVIPSGYIAVTKPLRITGRSIKSLKEKNIHTTKPLVFEQSVTREAAEAIKAIDSTSFIICSEDLEDLIYERLNRLETEVLPFEKHFVFIEGEREWGNDQFLAFEEPVNLIVDGLLTFKKDVTVRTVEAKIAALDLFGEIQVSDTDLIGILQRKIRVNEGRIIEQGKQKGSYHTTLHNIGELSL